MARLAMRTVRLAHAPHTAEVVTSEDWERPYTREQAAFPSAFTRESKFWPLSAVLTMFMATAIWFAPVYRLRNMHKHKAD